MSNEAVGLLTGVKAVWPAQFFHSSLLGNIAGSSWGHGGAASCGWESSGGVAHLQAKATFSLHLQKASGWPSRAVLARTRGRRQMDVF